MLGWETNQVTLSQNQRILSQPVSLPVDPVDSISPLVDPVDFTSPQVDPVYGA